MAAIYTRYRLRGRLLEILEGFPLTITADDIAKLWSLAQDLHDIYIDFTSDPYDYVADVTRAEHSELSRIFGRLNALVLHTINSATDAFRRGKIEFVLDPAIVEIRNQLAERAQGDSAISVFLSNFFKGGELQTNGSD